MSIEIIGIFSTRGGSEDRPVPMSTFDTDFQRELVQAYDRNDYDRILIANGASWPDSIPLAAYLSGISERVGWMIAHRPGFVAPTMAARMLATIDQQSHGRTAVHIITGGNDEELRADGDHLPKATRYRRSAEYVEVMRREWSSDRDHPFDHKGEFYEFKGAYSQVRPYRGDRLPVYWGGMSPESLQFAAMQADCYAFAITSLRDTGALIEKVRAEATKQGRALRFCMSFRVICAASEAEAWALAERILAGVLKNASALVASSMAQQNRTTAAPLHERLASLFAQGSIVDKRLWTEISRATRGTRAATALVGAPDQIVDALLDYYDLGVTSFLMSGFEVRSDPDYFGRTIIPQLRAACARREKPASSAS